MWSWAVAGVCALIAVALTVAMVRSRRDAAAALADRGWLLECERTAAARDAVTAERARIARELHDIVSHNVSVMVVQAGAARQVLARKPDEAVQALTAVESAGRDTMRELRQLLGVLAPSPDGNEPDQPQPSLSRLGELVDRIAFAGLPVQMRVDGELGGLLAGVDATAYRVIQEALTNALKHGCATAAQVQVRRAEQYLRLEIVNDGPSVLTGGAAPVPGQRGTGRGLLGLAERVRTYGGDLDARRRIGGGFRVRAKIPLTRP